MFRRLSCVIFSLLGSLLMTAQDNFETDRLQTAGGELAITFIGHGSLLFTTAGMTIYIDPYGELADYGRMPKADLIFITHQHRDHFDLDAIDKIRRPDTQIFLSALCQPAPPASRVLKNGDRIRVRGIDVAVVPAYNIVHKRPNGLPFHPRGEGNGYVFTFADTAVYVAGDTEFIPEMAALENIAVAFLPMNLPYTMTPEMTAQAAKSFRPRMLYPYHFGDTDPQKLVALLAGEKGISVRIRKMN
jgi:L-ascorbate metabolism protein UlaG (beta-lactamase superfamily)